MNPISGINQQISTVQTQAKDNTPSNNSGISFGGVFEAVRRSLDGIMVISGSNMAAEADFNKSKLEVEKAREFETELEHAQDILCQIAKIMEKHNKGAKD